jgi:hypothetical protein
MQWDHLCGTVEVLEHGTTAPAAFADGLREAVLTGATFYGTIGRPITLRVVVDKVHFKNALRALTIGDDNQADARVAVFDRPTGQQIASFSANADESGQLATSIAIGIIGTLDPTGIVGIADAIGSAASADINPSGTVTAMRANLAAETLRKTFGDARTQAVTLARQNKARRGGQTRTFNALADSEFVTRREGSVHQHAASNPIARKPGPSQGDSRLARMARAILRQMAIAWCVRLRG